MEKSTPEVRGHKHMIEYIGVPKFGHFASITPFDAFEINSQVMFIVEDIPCYLFTEIVTT